MEMAAVMATITILASILFPVFARAREHVRANACRMNLLNVFVALRVYAADYDGPLPLGLDGPVRLAEMGLITEQTLKCPSFAGELAFPPAQPPAGARRAKGKSGRGEKAPRGQRRGPSRSQALGPPAATRPLPGPGPAGVGAGSAVEAPAYVYASGHRYGERTHSLLIADARARHCGRANVLFTDGSLRLLPAPQWESLLPEDLARACGWMEARQKPMANWPPRGE
jgi:prepilin-type processing-associated H-X9-DG protein